MAERVNHLARRRFTQVLGVIAALTALAGPARASAPPGAPTGSKVEIIFLDAAGQPISRWLRATAATPREVEPPAPSRSTPPPTPAVSTGHPAPPLRATTAGSWGASRRHPILGDGSNATELVAAAQRVVGLRGLAERSIVAHVFASAGVPLTADAVDNDGAMAALVAAGRQVVGAGAGDLAFGDVVFFTGPRDATVRFGIVEGVDPEGRVHVIGEGGDVVSRFVLSARHHALRAVARP